MKHYQRNKNETNQHNKYRYPDFWTISFKRSCIDGFGVAGAAGVGVAGFAGFGVASFDDFGFGGFAASRFRGIDSGKSLADEQLGQARLPPFFNDKRADRRSS